MSFASVSSFEGEVCAFFGAPYGVAVDSCTHALELCLLYTAADKIIVPSRTYISIPFLSRKLGIPLEWNHDEWSNYYYLTPQVIDAAVLWGERSYVSNTLMCLSFQYQKHLGLGRGGMILTDSLKARESLMKMAYDGRERNIPWREQNIDSVGYHYYMTPETAELGLEKLPLAKKSLPRSWKWTDWPDLTQLKVFS